MSYNPKVKVIDLRKIVPNILTYIQANQSDALLWANEGAGLAPIAKFYRSAAGRLTTVFPCLMVVKKESAQIPQDTTRGSISIVFELMLSGSDTDQLSDNAGKYTMALESLLANVPESVLTGGTVQRMFAHPIESLEADYEAIKGNPSNSAFLQRIQIRAIYQVFTG